MHREDQREECRLDPAARRRSPAVTCVGRRVDAIMAGVLLCLIASCAHYAPKSLAPEKTLATFEARGADDAAVRQRVETLFPSLAANWPPARWDRKSVV